jgi:hypothetical protein
MHADELALLWLLGFLLMDTVFHLVIRRPPPVPALERRSALPAHRTETRC